MQTRTHSEDPANSRMAPNNNEASGVSHPAAPAHGDLPLPKSSNSDAKGGALKPSEEPAPFGAEVVGGHTVSFYHSKRGRWAPAEIVGFDPATGKHSLRIEGASGDTWAALGSSKFKWIQRRAGAEPNPSFAGSPRREDAVGRRARIFWPGMGRYYQGLVKSYDTASDKHRVDYCDGDSVEHELRHEAVVWMSASDAAATVTAVTPAATPGNNGVSAIPAKAVHNGAPLPPGASGPPQLQQQQLPKLSVHAPSAGNAAAAPTMATPVIGDSLRSGSNDGVLAATTAGTAAATTATTAAKPSPLQAAGKRKDAADADLAQLSGGGCGGSDCPATVKRPGAKKKASTTSHKKGAARRADDDYIDMEGEEEEEEEEDDDGGAGGVAPQKLAVGSRIAMHSGGSFSAFLRGRMSGYHPSDGRHRIRFDDASSRLLNMRGKPFSWVSPRSRAAGYSRPLHEALARMGADNVPPVGPCNPGPALTLAAAASSHPSAPLMLPLAPVAAAASASVSEQSGDAATGGVAVPPLGFSATVPSAVLPGQRVCLFWPGDGLWYPGEVLRYDEDQGLHFVLYCDGESEWVELAAETLLWAPPDRSASLPFGICHGNGVPQGRAAVGWRVSVDCPREADLVNGFVVGQDGVTLKVRYDDGRLESVSLADNLVVWRAPPGGGGGGGHYERRAAATVTTPRTALRDHPQAPAGVSGSRVARKGGELRRQAHGSRGVRRPSSSCDTDNGVISDEDDEGSSGAGGDGVAGGVTSSSSSEEDDDDVMGEGDEEHDPMLLSGGPSAKRRRALQHQQQRQRRKLQKQHPKGGRGASSWQQQQLMRPYQQQQQQHPFLSPGGIPTPALRAPPASAAALLYAGGTSTVEAALMPPPPPPPTFCSPRHPTAAPTLSHTTRVTSAHRWVPRQQQQRQQMDFFGGGMMGVPTAVLVSSAPLMPHGLLAPNPEPLPLPVLQARLGSLHTMLCCIGAAELRAAGLPCSLRNRGKPSSSSGIGLHAAAASAGRDDDDGRGGHDGGKDLPSLAAAAATSKLQEGHPCVMLAQATARKSVRGGVLPGCSSPELPAPLPVGGGGGACGGSMQSGAFAGCLAGV